MYVFSSTICIFSPFYYPFGLKNPVPVTLKLQLQITCEIDMIKQILQFKWIEVRVSGLCWDWNLQCTSNGCVIKRTFLANTSLDGTIVYWLGILVHSCQTRTFLFKVCMICPYQCGFPPSPTSFLRHPIYMHIRITGHSKSPIEVTVILNVRVCLCVSHVTNWQSRVHPASCLKS